jgi:peptidoglycan/xylan/chitin deacetylase (PgdA/CDA1 family)
MHPQPHAVHTRLCQPRQPIAILAYHQVADAPDDPPPYHLQVLPPRQFAMQLGTLHALGWRGLSLRDLEPYLRGEKTGKVFGITLDDGYRNNFENALPVLRTLGFSATCFMVSGMQGGTNAWDLGRGIAPVPLMDRDQLRAWVDAGMEIGSHTRQHVNLRECDEERAWDEIHGARQELEQALGSEVTSFSYPHGLYTARDTELVQRAGYRLATTVATARAADGDDPLQLPRVSVDRTDSLAYVVARVVTPMEEWRTRLRAWRNGRAPRPTAAGHLPKHE